MANILEKVIQGTLDIEVLKKYLKDEKKRGKQGKISCIKSRIVIVLIGSFFIFIVVVNSGGGGCQVN